MEIIKNIPIEKLENHPRNIRTSYNDLDELAASIRTMGILQNLTVVEAPDMSPEKEHYYVLIGNRRLKAAKIAGLTEVPCVIADMTEVEQVEVMTVENMQRSDLTPYEEGMAFEQMTLFNIKPEEIAKKTGISVATIRSRRELAKLDRKLVESRLNGEMVKDGMKYYQISLGDLAKLAKVDSLEERNLILSEAKSSSEIEYRVKQYLDDKLMEKRYREFSKMMKSMGIPENPKVDNWYSNTQELYRYNLLHDQVLTENDVKDCLVEGAFYYRISYNPSVVIIATTAKADPEVEKKTLEREKRKEKENELKERFTALTESMRMCAVDIIDRKLSAPKDTDFPERFRNALSRQIQNYYGYCSYPSGFHKFYFGKSPSQEEIKIFEEKELTPEDILLLIVGGTITDYYHFNTGSGPLYKENECKRLRNFAEILHEYGYILPEGTEGLLDGTDEVYHL